MNLTPDQLTSMIQTLGFPIFSAIALGIVLLYTMRKTYKLLDTQYRDHRADLREMTNRFVDAIDRVSVNYQNFTLKAEARDEKLVEVVEKILKRVGENIDVSELIDHKVDNLYKIILQKKIK